MKIALNANQGAGVSGSQAQDKDLAKLIQAAKRGDWTAAERLTKNFMPVIQEIVSQCKSTTKDRSLLVEAGRRGVIKAARKYRTAQGPHAFRVAVVEHIERAVNTAANGSFFSKLFGG